MRARRPAHDVLVAVVLLVALGVFVLGALAGTAAAAPRVAIVGDDEAVVAALEKALAGKVEQVDASDGALQATVRVTVSGGRKARKPTATVVVLQGDDGAQVGKLVVRERRGKLAGAVGKQAWKKLGKAIGAARPRAPVTEPVVAAPPPPPPPRERERVAETSPRPSGSPDDAGTAGASVSARTPAPASRRPARLTLSVDERPFIRRLRWNDDLDQVLRRYDLAANAVGVTLAARPLRGLSALYVQLAGEATVGVSGSRTDEGMEFGTSSWELAATAGLTARLGGAFVGVAAAAGEHRFSIDGDEGMGGELVPDAAYRYARGGVDLQWPLASRWLLSSRAGYRHLLGTGDLTNGAWFPRATGRGVDGSLGVDVRLSRRISAYARGEVRHYFFAMNPQVGDELIAGGAVDTYLGAALGLSLAVP